MSTDQMLALMFQIPSPWARSACASTLTRTGSSRSANACGLSHLSLLPRWLVVCCSFFIIVCTKKAP